MATTEWSTGWRRSPARRRGARGLACSVTVSGVGESEQRDAAAHSAGASVVAVAAGEVQRAQARRNPVLAVLLGCRSEHTRRAYAGDVSDFFDWCDEGGSRSSPYAGAPRQLRHRPRRAAAATGRPAAASTVARRLAALAEFYDNALDEGLIASSPVTRVRRPRVESDSPSTGLDRDEQRALLAAAQADGPGATALVTLLLHKRLRID
ncbi:MAG: hypothetical protein EKK42_15115 [Pseudonocardiaceae bacterium]|nr:MAG: hypothetical protein EKK42_15115 [Pseudonocardiaceae bacterium]